MGDVSKYRFGKSFIDCSAGDFRAKVRDRWPKLSKKDENALVDMVYGKEPDFIEVEEEVKDGNSGSVKDEAGASEG